MTTVPQPANPANPQDAEYDAWNRLVEYGDGFANPKYEYDGLNRRIVEASLIGRSIYYNENWQVLADRSPIDNSARQFVWHPYYIDALAVTYAISSGDRHYYLQDANFNVTAAVEDDGDVVERYRYTPYGEPKFLNADFSVKGSQTSAIGNEILYTGRERDASTGLQLNRNRFYHNRLGRWLTRDPIGYEGSQWNLYKAYFVPYSTDPSGLIDEAGIIDDILQELHFPCIVGGNWSYKMEVNIIKTRRINNSWFGCTGVNNYFLSWIITPPSGSGQIPRRTAK